MFIHPKLSNPTPYNLRFSVNGNFYCQSGISIFSTFNHSFLHLRSRSRVQKQNHSLKQSNCSCQEIQIATNFIVTNIFPSKPQVFITKQRFLGFNLDGQPPTKKQKLDLLLFVPPKSICLVLKKVEVSVETKRKYFFQFCLVGEERWLVFK